MDEPSPSIPNASPKNRRQTARRRTESEQQMYSSKLIKRVRSLRRRADSADRTLVDSAKAKTHWSRAMLKRYLKRKRTRPDYRFRKPMFGKKLPQLQSKMRALNRLIPGCRKLSLPSLIEETTDYIAALEMQVKAMAVFTAIVNGAGTAGAFVPKATSGDQ